MKRLFLSLSFLCFLQFLFGQPAMTEEQLRNWRTARPVSQFSSQEWPGQLIKSPRTEKIDNALPMRGLAIQAPRPAGVDQFCQFIEEELAPAHFNILILRIDWNYAYESDPDLRDPVCLSKADVKKMVAVCQKHDIQLVPQINLLGHQSWAGTTYALLRKYPHFDEAPHINTDNYNDYTGATNNPLPYSDGLYCKSYCPLHPEVHGVVFPLVDELMDVFEAEWFHAGLDEVFHIGDERCPRCGGKDKAELFAGEVNKIRDHLAEKNRRLMIWGDRLIDGSITGLGTFNSSYNNTHRAIDMINKDVFICEWRYSQTGLSAVYLVYKGFDVALCPYRNVPVALQHVKDMVDWRQRPINRLTTNRFQGVIHTVWSGAEGFMRLYYNPETYNTPLFDPSEQGGDARALKVLIDEFKKLNL